jgi:hypothetical protein
MSYTPIVRKNKMGNWKHLKIIQTIPEQQNWEE